MTPIAIDGMLAILSPGMYLEFVTSLLSETSGGANPNVRNSHLLPYNQQVRIHRSDHGKRKVRFASRNSSFRWSAQFAGEYIVGSSETLGSKAATKPKDAKIGDAKQEKSCQVLEKLNSGPPQRSARN